MTRHSTDSTKVILLRLWFNILWCIPSVFLRSLHWFQQLEPQPFGEVRHLLGYFVRLVAQWNCFIPHRTHLPIFLPSLVPSILNIFHKRMVQSYSKTYHTCVSLRIPNKHSSPLFRGGVTSISMHMYVFCIWSTQCGPPVLPAWGWLVVNCCLIFSLRSQDINPWMKKRTCSVYFIHCQALEVVWLKQHET